MQRLTRLTILLMVAALLAPLTAQARAGLGASMGSRGSRSYYAPAPTRLTPYSAAPLQQPSASPYSSYGNPYPPRRSSFMTGLVAGMAGAFIGHMLFGSHFFSGLFGFLIEIVLIVFAVRWLLGWLAQRQVRGGGFQIPPTAGAPLQLSQVDYAQFSRLLVDIQSAWSERDPARLRGLTTSDMLTVFERQLADLMRSGRRNVVSDVRLLHGELSEAWTEGAREYATVAMRYSMRDVTYDHNGQIVDGSPSETVTVTELWTFVRGGGAPWILSAIQQAR